MPTHSIIYTTSYTDGTSSAVHDSWTDTQTAGESFIVEETIAIGASDLEVTLTADVSEMQAFYMKTSAAGLLVETNSSSAPDQTFSLTTTQPVVWSTDHWAANPITTDITSLFLTNTSGVELTFYCKVLQDPTP